MNGWLGVPLNRQIGVPVPAWVDVPLNGWVGFPVVGWVGVPGDGRVDFPVNGWRGVPVGVCSSGRIGGCSSGWVGVKWMDFIVCFLLRSSTQLLKSQPRFVAVVLRFAESDGNTAISKRMSGHILQDCRNHERLREDCWTEAS